MKNFLGTMIFAFLALTGSAQFNLAVKVVDQQTSQPVEAATITLLKNNATAASGVSVADGTFRFTVSSPGTYRVRVKHISLQQKTVEVIINQPVNQLLVQLTTTAYYLEPLEVKSIRATDKAPFTKLNLSKAYFESINLGQDLPILLDQTPSVVVNSDAGNGVGYTGLRIRGTDASRINVTINGIPYNDAESQGTFYVNLPDFASSLNSVQIQRGVGTSSNGAGAFGATINLGTNEFNPQAYGELNNSYGSFNTFKNTVKAGSGLLGNHFTVDARLSRITSDGFVDRAKSNLQSFYFSTAYVNDKSSLRFNIISGKEKTYQSWNGLPENLLTTNRTFNTVGTEKPGEPYDNETDNYQQDHYQLFFNHKLSGALSFNTAAFLSRGKGYYEQYKAAEAFGDYNIAGPTINGAPVTNTDLVRQLWLNNYYYGQIYSLQYTAGSNQLTFGGGWNRYDGKHYGEVIWAEVGIPKNYRYYNLNAFKTDVNFYTKWQHTLTNRLQIFADLQYRAVRYKMNGFRNNPGIVADRNFNFVNPKAGITYTHNGWQWYLSYALGNREPNRDDFEAGILQQPTFETLHNIEAGIEKKQRNMSYGINYYYMYYRNQLVLTGKINDVGAYARQNIPNSYRMGIEMQGSAVVSSLISLAANLTFSQNKIKRFTEYIDDYDTGKQNEIVHTNTDISFSPSVVGGATITLNPIKNGSVSLVSKYVGRQYLDNTQNNARSLDPYYVQDVRVSYIFLKKVFKEMRLIAQVGNVFNNRYEPNGYTFSYLYNGTQSTENFYYPMAGTNIMMALNIKL